MTIASLGALVNPVDLAAYLTANPVPVRSVITVTSTVTLAAAASTTYFVLIGAGATVTLPTAVGNTNLYWIKNIDTGNQTLSTTSSQTIDGSTTAPLTPNTVVVLISDGTNWRVF